MNQFLFGKANKKTTVIARIGVMLALTLAVQYLVGLAGQQMLTGPVVNMMLIITAMTSGLVGGVCVGLITPYIGFLLGLSGNILLTPFIGVANALYIAVFAVVLKLLSGEYGELKSLLKQAISIALGAVVKYLFLFFIALKIFLPLIMPTVPPALAVTFGVTQLITALIGGAAAIGVGYILKVREII